MDEKTYLKCILPQANVVLGELPIPCLRKSPEGRAFSLAVELADTETAARSLQSLVCRQWTFVPITLCGLALNLSRAISRQNADAVVNILHAMLDYVDFPVAA